MDNTCLNLGDWSGRTGFDCSHEESGDDCFVIGGFTGRYWSFLGAQTTSCLLAISSLRSSFMSLLPIQAGAQALQLGAAAGAAATQATLGFASLLGSALKSSAETLGSFSTGATPSPSQEAATGQDEPDVSSLKKSLGGLLRSFHDRLQGALNTQGVATQQEFRVTQDPFGDLRVEGLHPQRREIELALSGDTELQAMFSAIVQTACAVLNAESGGSEDSVDCGVTVSGQTANATFASAW